MISYRDFINTQERSHMTEDEKLEKKNSEILMIYRTVSNSINNKEITKKIATKTDMANLRTNRNMNKR